MKIFFKLMLVMLVSLLFFSITGCNHKNAKDSTSKEESQAVTSQNTVENADKEIKIAYIAMPNAAPQVLINEKEKIFENLLDEKGFTVKWVLTRSLDNIWPMMDKDEVDFVYIPTQNFVTYVTETSNFGGSDKYRIIAGSLDHNFFLLMIDSKKIKSLNDLDKKTVGIVNNFYVEEMWLNQQLKGVGLSTKSMGGTVEVEYLDWMNKLWDNFGSGKYAGIITWTSVQGAVEKKFPTAKFLPTDKIDKNEPSIPQNSLVAKKDLIDNDPEIVKLILEAHIKATEIALESNATLPLLAKSAYENYFDNVLKAADYPKYSKEFMIKDWSDSKPTYDPNLDYLKEAYNFTVKAGYMKNKQLDNLVNVNPINEVLSDLNKSPIK